MVQLSTPIHGSSCPLIASVLIKSVLENRSIEARTDTMREQADTSRAKQLQDIICR